MSNETDSPVVVSSTPETQNRPDGQGVAAETVVAEPNPTDGAEPSEAKPTEKTAEQRLADSQAAERRRLTKLERTNARLYQESEQLRQEVERYKASAPKQEREHIQVDPDEIERVISTRVEQKARQARIDEKCNAIVERGDKEFTDFNSALKTLGQELTLFEPRTGSPTPVMEVILEADKPEALLHYLGQNPDIASELADLSTIQLTRRLDKIEREMTQKPQPSSAPTPIEPVKPRASSSIPDPEKDPSAWIAYRNKQEAEKRKR